MGIGDAVAGKAKEAAGAVTGKDELQEEGAAQSEKGMQDLKSSKEETKADAHESKAEMAEAKQEAARKSGTDGPNPNA